MRLDTSRRDAPARTAIAPISSATFGSRATAGSPATGNEAVGVGTGVGPGAGVGVGVGVGIGVGVGSGTGARGNGSTNVRFCT